MPSLFPDPKQSEPTWISAHCDGGARGNPGPAGYGAVLTDASGHILAELSEFLDNGYKALRVVSDSELMVKQIQGKYKVNSPDLRPLWQEARNRIAQLDRFEITHALRHKNKDADRLANEAMDRGTGRAPSKPATSSPTSGTRTSAPPLTSQTSPTSASPQKPAAPTMLRGFTRDGVVHLLGSTTLPDGIFVKVIPE